MSIADHFDHAPDAGFIRAYDSRAARRQFKISVALILVLSLAAFTLGFVLRFDDAAGQANPAPTMHQVTSLDA
ncbi:MAG: hypothetical protein WAN31_08230 [Methylovirgula sp.]|jgi:hypothetical protein